MSDPILHLVNEKLAKFEARIERAEAAAYGSFDSVDAGKLKMELRSLRAAVDSLQAESRGKRERLETLTQQEVARQLKARDAALPATLIQCLKPAIEDIAALEKGRKADREQHKAEMDTLRAGAGAAALAAKNAAAANVAVARDLLVGGCLKFVHGR